MPATGVDPGALRLARRVAREEIAGGARAVILTGSHATGTAGADSDVDVVVVGRGRAEELRRRSGYLLSITRWPFTRHRAAFRDPALAGSVIPGWRDAIIVSDDSGIASQLQERARAWRWEQLAGRSDAWVAERITGFAEEVHKLVACSQSGCTSGAAAQRSVLVLHMAKITAVRHRMLYGSENVMWKMVSDGMGEPWAGVQARAFGANGERFKETCGAALELYRLAAADAAHLLDAGQRAVISHACRLSEQFR